MLVNQWQRIGVLPKVVRQERQENSKLRGLSKWTTAKYKVPFGIDDILTEMRPNEVPREMSDLLKEIVL
jgi:hypothetical protein